MNKKRIFGILLILVGVGLYFYCQHGKQRMQDARNRIDAVQGVLPETPVTDVVPDPFLDAAKKEAYRRVDQYKEPIRLCFIGSGVLVVGGLLFLIFGTSKKKKRK